MTIIFYHFYHNHIYNTNVISVFQVLLRKIQEALFKCNKLYNKNFSPRNKMAVNLNMIFKDDYNF